MAVILLAVGSRGDVQPLAELAGALAECGVPCHLVGLAEYSDIATARGVDFTPLPVSLADTLSASQRVRTLASRSVVQAALLRRFTGQLTQPLAAALSSRVRPGDTILTGLLGAGAAASLAEARGCRVATLLFTGQTPTRYRGSHFFSHAFTRWDAYNRWGADLNWRVAVGLGNPITHRVRQALRLRRWCGRDIVAAVDSHPIIVASSPLLVPPAPDWPPHVHQTGFLHRSDARGPLPDELTEFLDEGDPPVFVGVGSFTGAVTDEAPSLLHAASLASGRRIVTQAHGAVRGRLAETVLAVEAPHDALFPRMAALIHHGGAGTSQQGLLSGRPQVAVPFGADQPYHGRRLHALGVGPSPVSFSRLTPPRLALLIRELADGPNSDAYARRAATIAELTRETDGLSDTVQLLRQWGYLD